MALAAPLVSRKRQRYPKQGSCPKTHANRPPARRGAACLTLLAQCSSRSSGNGAATAASGESCRDSGHGFSSLFDPKPTLVLTLERYGADCLLARSDRTGDFWRTKDQLIALYAEKTRLVLIRAC
jgi:hypothetical protein